MVRKSVDVRLMLILALSTVLFIAACGPADVPMEAEVPAEEVPAAMVDDGCAYNEAPMLAAQVAAGVLPSVCERLPIEPLVLGEGLAVNPDWVDVQIGDYGGSMIYTFIHVEIKEPIFITDNRDPQIQAGGVFRLSLIHI